MVKRVCLLACACTLLGLVSVGGRGQTSCTEDESVAAVIDAVRRQIPIAKSAPLRAARLWEPHDRLLATVMRGETTYAGPAVAIRFYQVTQAPFSVASGVAKMGVIEVHQHLEWTVALTGQDHAFVLAGGERVSENYNRLAAIAGIRLGNTDEAEALLGFYLSCTRQPEVARGEVVGDFDQLRIAILKERRSAGATGAPKDLEAVWRLKAGTLKRILRYPRAAAARDGRFEVAYFTYRAGVLVQRTVAFREDGSAEIQPDRSVIRLW